MRNRLDDYIMIAALVVLSALVWTSTTRTDNAERQRDAARTQVTAFVHELVNKCSIHGDGSGECPAGTFIATTTTVAMP